MVYAFDPDLAPVAPLMPRFDIADVPAAREQTREFERQAPPLPDAPGLLDEEVHVPATGPDRTVRCRVFRPADDAPGAPAVIHLHGGAFVAGSVDLEAGDARRFAAELGAVVVSVDYRLAPDHPYPAALDDVHAVLEFLAGGAYGVDADRIAVAGQSAGGGLAAALTLRVRDHGGPTLAGLCLSIPELDHRLDTPSMTAYDDTPIWTRTDAHRSWAYYLGDTDPVPAYASPAVAEDLTGLPPAYVSVCEFDPLRDEGMAYASRLVQAGVPTELHLFPGTFHGAEMVAGAAVAERMVAEKTAALGRLLRARAGVTL
ncbi:alpha/beta hydrolase [Pseudonocardia nematodicida]|uniref:Alpha/beta hydrolase n=1 Tax=Pseudonocardia nematodicida TaxID=1206997 RepID=A0ABV1K7P3_9PSEU